MFEVEVKIAIDSADSIEKKLTEQNFIKSMTVKETDTYFNGVDRDFRQSDEALRLRNTINNYDEADPENVSWHKDNVITTMTYKGHKLDNVSMSRKEIETEIDDYEKMFDILTALGYKPVIPVVKVRKYFHDGYITACVDRVQGLGDFLELEIITESEEKRKWALGKIENQLLRLGLSMADTTTTSYLSMLEKMQE